MTSNQDQLVVVALGGNSITKPGALPDIPHQFAQTEQTARVLADAVVRTIELELIIHARYHIGHRGSPGASGVGKSELALSLISRGHRLIADDITAFSRVSPSAVDGMHPGLSNDFMEVRGLGIVNIRAMFGSNALRRNKTLRMIVNMVEFTPENQHEFDRLGSTQKTRNMLGLEIPEFTLPVSPGRNLAVLVEAAARNHLLRMGGYNSAEDFIERQRRAIKANAKG